MYIVVYQIKKYLLKLQVYLVILCYIVIFQGVSESWWGMYEVIAPPVFLLTNKLDPIFAQSKAYLVSIGVPQTETDQFIYNQVGFSTRVSSTIQK
jgi:hypothetical protein